MNSNVEELLEEISRLADIVCTIPDVGMALLDDVDQSLILQKEYIYYKTYVVFVWYLNNIPFANDESRNFGMFLFFENIGDEMKKSEFAQYLGCNQDECQARVFDYFKKSPEGNIYIAAQNYYHLIGKKGDFDEIVNILNYVAKTLLEGLCG